MELTKAHWLNDGDNVRLVMPISKIDVENRLVSGFASLNNVDKHDDVVTAEASAAAFSAFRGNIREMHQPIAAGRLVSFTQEPFYDASTGNTYEGIYVTAYVSKGAPDTWAKVVDGTLSGFSIGGIVKDQHTEYVPDLQKTIRFITGLDLFELSLVDNPANQLANVLSIVKVDGEYVAKGMATEVQTHNVFWCPTDKTARSSPDDSAKCYSCSEPMDNIGWIEVTDSVTYPAELRKFVDTWLEKVITAAQIKEQLGHGTVQQSHRFANEQNIGDNDTDTNTAEKSEGGVNVSNVETVEKAAEVVETAEEPVEKAVQVEEVVEPVEKAVEGEEEEVSEEVPIPATLTGAEVESEVGGDPSVAKAIDEIKTFVSEAVTKSASEQATFAETLSNTLDEVKKSLESVTALAEAIEKANSAIADVASKVSNLERATAVKKSGDDDSSEPVKKEFSWGGHFASASTITK